VAEQPAARLQQGGGRDVPYYRVFFIGNDGHFAGAREIQCNDDNEAIENARQSPSDLDIEIWHEKRMVTRISQDRKRA